MKAAVEFLELNGFIKNEVGNYINSKCEVVILTNGYRVITRHDGYTYDWYSNDQTIYSLIGYLTYYDLMDKNYKTNK
jgi:hypothetical protein